MAKIWYSVMKIEHKIATGSDTLMAGVVLKVAKNADGLISATQCFGAKKSYTFTVEQCKRLMTKPTQCLDSAMEESFMQSEANYC